MDEEKDTVFLRLGEFNTQVTFAYLCRVDLLLLECPITL